jgi:hypothetical protein
VTAAIARQLCLGVDYLHQHGIIHRDIKPSNVYVRADGIVTLLDFGVAISSAGEDDPITKVDFFVGTVRYAAPETLMEQSYTPSSDVYSVGVTMLFMISGRTPFGGSSLPGLINQISTGAFIDEIPEAQRLVWTGILSGALNPDRRARASLSQLIQQIEDKIPSGGVADSARIKAFLEGAPHIAEFEVAATDTVESVVTSNNDESLSGAIQSLARQIAQVQAVVSDVTIALNTRETRLSVDQPAQQSPEDKVEATFVTVRRRLELNWGISLVMTIVLFSLFVAMLILAVVFGLIYQKSYWGLVFGGTSVLSLLTVVVWKPLDKMMFSTIATQQLELVQLNYQRALSGTRAERREAFRDVSTQLNALLTKISAKAR